jgi:hypothetical protein
MRIQLPIALAMTLLALISMPIAQFVLGDPPEVSNPESTTRRDLPALPKQAAYAHSIRLTVIAVTPVERTDKTKILKLDVERNYGKIDQTSLNRARQHESQRFTILFPAAPDADIRVGDLIDYALERCVAMGRE